MTTQEQLDAMVKECRQYSHVTILQQAAIFIKVVIERLGENEEFDNLVENQLSFCVGRIHPDPRWFFQCCNHPHHVIRNRLLSWSNDHPEANSEEGGTRRIMKLNELFIVAMKKSGETDDEYGVVSLNSPTFSAAKKFAAELKEINRKYETRIFIPVSTTVLEHIVNLIEDEYPEGAEERQLAQKIRALLC